MIGIMPPFMEKDTFVRDPQWHLTEKASDQDKKDFEEYMNDEYKILEMKEEHPEMKNPYYTWEGKIVDK